MKYLLKNLAFLAGLVVVIAVFVFGLSTYDYGWRCTKCLRDSHVVEHQFFGLTYWKTSTLRFAGHDMAPVTGSPCQHVFRTGGFGRSSGGLIGCGITGEGTLFRTRWEALASAFKLNEQLHDMNLLKATFKVVDELLPADATVSFYRTDTAYFSLPKLAVVSSDLEKTTSIQQWKNALERARTKNE